MIDELVDINGEGIEAEVFEYALLNIPGVPWIYDCWDVLEDIFSMKASSEFRVSIKDNDGTEGRPGIIGAGNDVCKDRRRLWLNVALSIHCLEGLMMGMVGIDSKSIPVLDKNEVESASCLLIM